ncbi:MAG: hypothetical protein A2381_09620 [Bdellovibrionales bacterium RIFOXYB1_FULL_37_110]|nr:MAG: hypothetical protein A2417_02875 [Bdellovibrionales bacterium RIFOXYC1_FULL_37_79]OFZ59521.1 MAG: hypothetical protein A2381_09620 [Bdellovibrionales bacterium RIFOXYB1_FULL_37_110]OFZ64239.1 MAG: hypothetical protein A2577_12470 [Bdellovibrionales bacterium RIFOXYD1_FULL_36_51]
MIKQLSLSALIALYLNSFCAFAALDGQGTGNGGDVLVCKNPDSSIQSIILYDFYEAKFRHDITLDLDDNSTSLNDKVTSIINKIKRLNPTRATLYEKWWKEFQLPENTTFTSDTLSDIPDTGEVSFPPNCEIVQAAHQKKPMSGERRYKIRKDLWDQMDNTNKAGLVIHELIYREAKEENAYIHPNSKRVRYLNATFFSYEFDNFTIDKYLYMLAYDVLFSKGDWRNIPIKELFDVRPGSVFGPSQIDSYYIDFYQDGELSRIKGLLPDKTQNLTHIAGILTILPYNDSFLGVDLHPNDQIKELYFYSVQATLGRLSLKYENPNCDVNSGYSVTFHSNSQIQSVTFYNSCLVSNNQIRIKTKKPLFSPSGFLIGKYTIYGSDDEPGEINYNGNWYISPLIVFSKDGDGQIESICIQGNPHYYDNMKCGPLKPTIFEHEDFIGNFKATSTCSKKPSDYLESTKEEAIKKCNDFLKEKLEHADISLFSCPTSCVEEKCEGGIFSSKKQVVCTAETKYNSN